MPAWPLMSAITSGLVPFASVSLISAPDSRRSRTISRLPSRAAYSSGVILPWGADCAFCLVMPAPAACPTRSARMGGGTNTVDVALMLAPR